MPDKERRKEECDKQKGRKAEEEKKGGIFLDLNVPSTAQGHRRTTKKERKTIGRKGVVVVIEVRFQCLVNCTVSSDRKRERERERERGERREREREERERESEKRGEYGTVVIRF